ncbi:MAG: SH3 domain-containing protein [Rhodospirillaceae bacterium]|jgi:hypothetical protein|nr:SH3 domain-containing protein [Rhodospirillaceae bacterium]MBT5667015.1 SH3 domain-containing protein [Rhodospirillaceae bacterium]MBT5812556.1 SH3 domain-containing protein [Rhodospirillaceae bacterium]
MTNQLDTDTPDAADVGPRRRSKTPLAATLCVILLVGSAVGWGVARFLIFQDEQGTNIDIPKTGKLLKKPEMAPEAKPTKSVQPIPAPISAPIPVDSYASDKAYDITQWVRGDQFSGYIDEARINGAPLPKDGSRPFAPGEVIELAGWTGEVNVGIRLPYVIASACDTVVGHAPVSGNRSDVAKAVHRNLSISGWRMRIASDSLPDCENRTLRVWGIVPGTSRLILPLNSHVPIPAPGQGADPTLDRKNIDAAKFDNPQPLMAQDMKPLLSLTLMVTAKALNIRACGDAKCAITGKFRKGEWTVVKLDETENWLLVATRERSGWVSRKYVQIGG